MKKVILDDTSLSVNGVNFDLDMHFRHYNKFDDFLDVLLTSSQNMLYLDNKRSFSISEKRFKAAMLTVEEVKP